MSIEIEDDVLQSELTLYYENAEFSYVFNIDDEDVLYNGATDNLDDIYISVKGVEKILDGLFKDCGPNIKVESNG